MNCLLSGKLKIKQAVILAGGTGGRLMPFTADKPKPMVEVNGRPFLEYLIQMLKENGIEEVVLLLGYLPNKITDYFGDGSRFGLKIRYHIGEVSDLTGTRIRNAMDMLKDDFLLMYCDNYWPMNLAKMTERFQGLGLPAMVTVYNNKLGRGEYGLLSNLKFDSGGRVLHYGDPVNEPEIFGLDLGFFLVEKSLLKNLPKGNFMWQDWLKELIKKGQLGAYVTEHPYATITNLDLLKRAEKFLTPKKVIFLDRDGVINKCPSPQNYVKSWHEFEFLPKAKEALSLLTQKGYQIFIVTNQRGVARGILTDRDVASIHEKFLAEVRLSGAEISGVYNCFHDSHEGCNCRKPRPGMLYDAAHDHHLILSKCFLIGDSESDILAGDSVGCQTIWLRSGRTLYEEVLKLP